MQPVSYIIKRLQSLDFFYIYAMATLTIEIPETVDIDKSRISMIVASKLYEQGRLSLGQASDVAGLTKRAFIELLADLSVQYKIKTVLDKSPLT